MSFSALKTTISWKGRKDDERAFQERAARQVVGIQMQNVGRSIAEPLV